MRLERFGFPAVVLAAVLEPNLLSQLEVVFVRELLASHTWTSFSPSETRFTILVRAALSGLGFCWYSDSRIA